MCGGGDGGIPGPTESSCPKEITLVIHDIMHSGNYDVWLNEIEAGASFTLEPDNHDMTIIVQFEDRIIGRLNNRQIYKCITEKGKKYSAILVNKLSAAIKLIRLQ